MRLTDIKTHNQSFNNVRTRIFNQVDIQLWDRVLEEGYNLLASHIKVQVNNPVQIQIHNQIKDDK